ncbi:RimK/LysX family protein [Shewanella gaetbuli]|uniref:RimK/LysX family protein n=1 Tax=Shewanella gaetbuli TaxID=220752 RepID=A0A9X2CLU1_9GAMM|nr:RimK/LysX family protein [Shewanella gaetbuli]MCL1143044.1 RimK/LysX family protein [Shewanella gaetbuli]
MFRSIIFAVVLCLSISTAHAEDKQILKQVEVMTVSKSGLMYEARIDTGAAKSSLHAYDLKIIGGESEKMQHNIGKMIEFTTENERGEKQRLQSKIVSTSTVRNSQGIETRYIVKLEIGFADGLKEVEVNLRNRSHMDYKLLIGRNFLKHDYIVDVSEKKTIGPTAKISIVETGLLFSTRIDTGAVENSLHAVNMRIENEDKQDKENNVGKMLTFTTMNEKGDKVDVRTKIRDTSLIRNAQGSEVRYLVRLAVGEPGEEFFVDVNLKDRSKMGHKLLIGRNWLQGHYLVDVSLK